MCSAAIFTAVSDIASELVDFRQHRRDVTNKAVTLMFDILGKRQRIARGLNEENEPETGWSRPEKSGRSPSINTGLLPQPAVRANAE